MQTVVSILLILGTALSAISAIGIHRLKDAYTRLHATSTVSTLGLISLLTASVFYFSGTSTSHSLKQLLAIVFIFITVPAGTHILSRAALARDVKVWKVKGSLSKEEQRIVQTLKEQRDAELSSGPH